MRCVWVKAYERSARLPIWRWPHRQAAPAGRQRARGDLGVGQPVQRPRPRDAARLGPGRCRNSQRKLAAGELVVTGEMPVINGGGLRRSRAPARADGGLPRRGQRDRQPLGARARRRRSRSRSRCVQRGAEPIMQLTCRDRNRLALQADLVGAALHGIENICCLTGDDVTAGDEPQSAAGVRPRRAAADRAGALDRRRALPLGARDRARRRRSSSAPSRTPARRRSRCACAAPRRRPTPAPRFLQLQICYRPELLERFIAGVHAARRHRALRDAAVDLPGAQRDARCASSTSTSPGSRCPPEVIARVEAAGDQERSASRSPASRPATRCRCPASPGMHLISFRKDAGIAKLCERLGIPPEQKGSNMDTVIRSRSRTVTIGAGQPFAIIGERINPTGRKVFAQELRDGDLARVAADATAQVAAGADMLDINAGIPLVDEAELLKAMIRMAQDDRRCAAVHRLVGDRGARGRARRSTRAARWSTRSPPRTSGSS